MRFAPFLLSLLAFSFAVIGAVMTQNAWIWGVSLFLGGFCLVGIFDFLQPSHSIQRNYPVTGRFRGFFYWLRPFLRQYIVESETEGRPFNNEQRSLVYRRAKNVSSVEPFGSHIDNDHQGYEWIAHSLGAVEPAPLEELRIDIGKHQCAKPYSASLFNISAMSYGSLGAHAVEALNKGAAKGQFFHDTGEGGISKFHRKGGGDLVWELGSGYFGCRD
jgi:glutamate synthase domain-containing protein 2